MSNDHALSSAQLILKTVGEILERGTRAVLVTVLESPKPPVTAGAKLIVHESGEIVGSLGNSDLDKAVAREA